MPTDASVYVPLGKLTNFMIDALVKMGVPPDDARIVAEILLASDLCGVRSHGIAHLKMYHTRIKRRLQLPVTRWSIVRETPTTAVVDGGNGMGMVVGFNAMKIAIEKARAHGLGAVAVRNSSHYGIAGYYTRMAAREGMVGMSFTNAHPSIAPTFGSEPMLGTNPIAFSAPTDEEFPFTFDAATSIAPRGNFVPLGSFRKTAGSIGRELRASRKAPGEERIYTAGEKAHGTAARVMAEGVEIPPGLQRSLNELRTELNLGNDDLGF